MPRPLKTLLICALLFSIVSSSHAQTGTIGIQFSTPTSHQTVDSNLSIQVTITSAYQINSVLATVQGTSAALTYNAGSGLYTGTLSLGGLPMDSSYTLSVTATDVNNNTQAVSESIFYDPPPNLTIVKPYELAVGRPTLDIKANCGASAGHCQLTVAVIEGTTVIPVGNYTDSVSTTMDVSAYQGLTNLQVRFTAVDQYNVQTYDARDFYVETSPYLIPVYTADAPIDGFSGSNVLVDDLIRVGTPRIVNITTGAATSIPFYGSVQYTNGILLTTPGAIFIGQTVSQAGTGPATLYDWNNGVLDSIAAGGSIASSLGANGNYCTWNVSANQFVRNLATHSTQWIGSGISNVADVSDSGAVVYSHSNFSNDSILMYRNGTSTSVESINSGDLLLAPLTDGRNVVYLRQDRFFNQTVYRYDANTGINTLLSTLGNPSQSPQLNTLAPCYRVNNGYTAFLQPDASSQYQAWIRDAAGNTAQATFFSIGCALDVLAPNGQLSYFNSTVNSNGLRYIYDKAAGSVAISGGQYGKAYYQDSSWYLTIGNELFRVNLQVTPDKADSFSIHVKEDSLYTFSGNDFVSHYHTSGSLLNVVLSRLPSHGSLKLNGVNVALNQVIARASLSTLVYQPVINFAGKDTMVWTGANGFTASPANALVVINVDSVLPTLPPAPVISGLNAGYCSNYGMPVSFSVTNMPVAGIGTTVAATLDGQPVAITSNGAMSIQPWTMQTGPHIVAVIFSNSVGADTTKAVFPIVQASTPMVTLAATPSTLTSSTQQVLLTATDVSGGGTAPLYTFSTDYSFNSNILQAESATNTMTVAVASLVVGRNVIYVRMKTSDSCAVRTVGVDSVVLVRVQDTVVTPPPPAPQISGLLSDYCQNAGAQQVGIANMPAAASGISVAATLDGQAVTVSVGGLITVQPQTLRNGAHTLAVIFANAAGADTTSAGFQIDSAVTPVVRLTVNPATLTATTTRIVLSASNVSGGGDQPLYTFSRDAGFTNPIVSQSLLDTAGVAVSSLFNGNNVFYVRMQTSDSCATANAATDSVQVVAASDTLGTRPGATVVTFGPNPFTGEVTIGGLQPNLSYSISLVNTSGLEMIRVVVQGQTRAVLQTGSLQRGLYFLRLIDLGSGKVISTIKLLSATP